MNSRERREERESVCRRGSATATFPSSIKYRKRREEGREKWENRKEGAAERRRRRRRRERSGD